MNNPWPEYQNISAERRGDVALITLQRPGANAGGGIPGGWGTQMLPRLIARLRARWLTLSAAAPERQSGLDRFAAEQRG